MTARRGDRVVIYGTVIEVAAETLIVQTDALPGLVAVSADHVQVIGLDGPEPSVGSALAQIKAAGVMLEQVMLAAEQLGGQG